MSSISGSPGQVFTSPGAGSSPQQPLSPSDSQRSREVSWASVYVTPCKAGTHHPQRVHTAARTTEQTPAQPVVAPAATQRSARRYCSALLVATVAAGATWSIGSSAMLALLDGDWQHLALARLVIGLGSVLPSASLLRSIRVYVRSALDVRVLIWALVLPALWLTLRSNLVPPISFREYYSARTCDVAYTASVLAVLALDAAAAAVPAACGLPDGFRIDHQLLAEYSVRAPNAKPP